MKSYATVKLSQPIKSPASHLEQKELIAVIEHLIGWYQLRRSPLLACSITEYIETLLMHWDQDSRTAERCQYKRLEKKWRYIAGQSTFNDLE